MHVALQTLQLSRSHARPVAACALRAACAPSAARTLQAAFALPATRAPHAARVRPVCSMRPLRRMRPACNPCAAGLDAPCAPHAIQVPHAAYELHPHLTKEKVVSKPSQRRHHQGPPLGLVHPAPRGAARSGERLARQRGQRGRQGATKQGTAKTAVRDGEACLALLPFGMCGGLYGLQTTSPPQIAPACRVRRPARITASWEAQPAADDVAPAPLPPPAQRGPGLPRRCRVEHHPQPASEPSRVRH
jgi:hypothetical protein